MSTEETFVTCHLYCAVFTLVAWSDGCLKFLGINREREREVQGSNHLCTNVLSGSTMGTNSKVKIKLKKFVKCERCFYVTKSL